MSEKGDRWADLIAGVFVAILLIFTTAMMIAIILVYWYGLPL
jgi:hypothetical protein